MFGIGSTELLVILVVALIVLGPKNLAGAARTLGKFVGEFKKVSTDFQRTLNAEAAQEEIRQREKQRKEKSASQSSTQSPAYSETPSFHPELDPDSPLAKALERTKMQAENSTEKKEQS